VGIKIGSPERHLKSPKFKDDIAIVRKQGK